jgi:hypothetical protein
MQAVLMDAPSRELVIRLHNATGLAINTCRRMLSELAIDNRERVVAEYESGRKFFPWVAPHLTCMRSLISSLESARSSTNVLPISPR